MPHRPRNQGKIYPKVRNGGDHSQEKGDIHRKPWGQKFLPWWRKQVNPMSQRQLWHPTGGGGSTGTEQGCPYPGKPNLHT